MKISRKSIIKSLGLLLGLFLLFLFLRGVDLKEVWNNVTLVGWKFIFLLLVSGFAYLLASIAWWLCFPERDENINIWRLFVVRQIGETLAIINPTGIVAGETIKVYLLKKKGVKNDGLVVSILLSRVLIFVSLIMLLFFAAIIFSTRLNIIGNVPLQFTFLSLSILLFIFIFYWLVSEKMLFYKFFKNRAKRFSFLDKHLETFKRINISMSQFYQKSKLLIILAFVLTTIHWMMGAVEFYLILSFLNIEITASGALMMEMGVSFLKNLAPFIPGQIGIEEYANRIMLQLTGISDDKIWVTVSILRRARQIFWLSVGGLFFITMYRKL